MEIHSKQQAGLQPSEGFTEAGTSASKVVDYMDIDKQASFFNSWQRPQFLTMSISP
jgi:hypothetical protein